MTAGRRHLTRCLLAGLGWTVVAGPSAIRAQDVQADVTMSLVRLNEEKQAQYRPLENQLREYVNFYEWADGALSQPIKCDIQIHVQSLTSTFEDQLSAEFYLSANNGRIYADRHWTFPLLPNNPLSHERYAAFDPFLGLVDFYVTLMVAEELDRHEMYGGQDYYNRAADLASQGRFSHRYTQWWDWRENKVKALLTDEHKVYRYLASVYNYGIFLLDTGNIIEAPDYIDATLESIEILKQGEALQQEYLQRFLEMNHPGLARMVSIDLSGEQRTRLKKADDVHAEYYDRHQSVER